MLTGPDLTKVLNLERQVAELSRKLASLAGTGVSTAHGALNIRTTQLGFRGVLTSAWDSSTGYSWERDRLEGLVYETPTPPLTGDKAVAVDGDQSLPAGTPAWFEPSPEANGYVFIAGGGGDSPDCLKMLVGAGEDRCFLLTVGEVDAGKCAGMDVDQELPLAWDGGESAYISTLSLTTPDGTVKPVKLWRTEEGEPALAYTDDSYRFTYAGCKNGRMRFLGGYPLCEDESDTSDPVTCADTFELLVECAACVDAPVLGCDECPDGIPSEFWACLTQPGDVVGGGVAIPSKTQVRYVGAPPTRDGVVIPAFGSGPGWYFEMGAGDGEASFRFMLRCAGSVMYLRGIASGSIIIGNAGGGADNQVIVDALVCDPLSFSIGIYTVGTLGYNWLLTFSAAEPMDCGGEAGADCAEGDDPIEVVVSSGANAGTYTTSSATLGVRTVTIPAMGDEYTITKDTDGNWTAYKTSAPTVVVPGTVISCPPLKVRFPGELFGSDDPVEGGPPPGGTGCTLLASDADAAVQIGGADAGSTTWGSTNQETGNVSLSGGPQIRFVAVGGVVYAQWYGASSTPGTDPADFSCAADATPVCGDTCYTAAFTDATLALLVGGTVALRVGDCATGCNIYFDAGPDSVVGVDPTAHQQTVCATGNWVVEGVFTQNTSELQVVGYCGSDVVVGDWVRGAGEFRLFINGGTAIVTSTVAIPDDEPITLTLSRTGAGAWRLDWSSTTLGTGNLTTTTALADEALNKAQWGGPAYAGTVTWSVANKCVSGTAC